MNCIVHGVTKSPTQWSNFHFHMLIINIAALSICAVGGGIFAYLHISTEPISRSRMLNQSVLQDVQKVCTNFKLPKAGSEHYSD